MNQYVSDTHALLWYLSGSTKLGVRAKAAFDEASAGNAIICIPAIVLAELFYLNEKLNRPLDFSAEYDRLRAAAQFLFVSLLPEDVLDFPRDLPVPEMHDRMIVGVARRLDAVCLTRDTEIAASGLVRTQWD